MGAGCGLKLGLLLCLAAPALGAGSPRCTILNAAADSAILPPRFEIVAGEGRTSTITVARADLSTGTTALVFPETRYVHRPGHWVDHSGPNGSVAQASPNLIAHLQNSARFRGVTNLKLEQFGAGATVLAFKATYERDGKPETCVVKVFSERLPAFRDLGDRAPQMMALLLQRQVGIFQYLRREVDAARRRDPNYNVEVADIDLDPHFIQNGILVQPLVGGMPGHGVSSLNEPGFTNFRTLLHQHEDQFTPRVHAYFQTRNPAYADGNPRFIDEGNTWENFSWEGGYRPPDFQELDVRRVTLFDW